MTKLCYELQNRLPTNFVLLEKMKILHPSESLKNRVHKLPITDLVKEFNDNSKKITQIENQWNNLIKVKWINVTSSSDFWNEVSKYRDCCNENSFRELSEFALNLLSLPYSNADVERVFSQLNLVKNKLRNRMSADTTNAILDIRYGLKRSGQCCHVYKVSRKGNIADWNFASIEAINSGKILSVPRRLMMRKAKFAISWLNCFPMPYKGCVCCVCALVVFMCACVYEYVL